MKHVTTYFIWLRRYRRLLLGLLVAAMIAGYLLHISMVETWAAVPGDSSTNVKRQVLSQLASATNSQGTVKEGANLKLLTLLAPNRNRVTLFVAEADFFDSRIEGADRWDGVLSGDVILVNSVDEFHRNNGGISERIAKGCDLQSLNPQSDKADQIGDVTFEPCQGPYSAIGIKQVANVAIMVWRDDKGRARCRESTAQESLNVPEDGYSSDPGYVSCLSGWISYAISDLLIRRTEVKNPPTVLIPALATGAGGVSPEATYQAYRRVVEDLLAAPEASSNLPEHLVLLLWRGWNPDQWAAHQIAIGNLTSELHNRWAMKAVKYRQPAPIAALLGVLSGLIALVLITAGHPTAVPKRLRGMNELKLAMTLVGWGLAALGLVAVLQATIGAVLRASLVTSFCLGLVGTLLAVGAERARDSFRDASKEDHEPPPL